MLLADQPSLVSVPFSAIDARGIADGREAPPQRTGPRARQIHHSEMIMTVTATAVNSPMQNRLSD